jgi:hypothetical protein
MCNKYLALVFLVLSFVFFGIAKAGAHCDTLDGPVVVDAKLALEKGDVTLVLKWVKEGAELEIRAAFQVALEERKTNKEAADEKFFETLVRVHRAGEGASLEGLKPAGMVEPIVAEADKALGAGSVSDLTSEMSNHLTSAVKEKFDRALEAKKHKDESVEAGREYVEAYVEYMHYVEGIYNVVIGAGGHKHEEAVKE